MELNRDFTATAKFFHWLMAAIIIVGWFIGFYGSEILDDKVSHLGKIETITLHKDIASTVLLLILLRSAWRLTHRPPHAAQASALQTLAVWAGHLALYVLMFVLPISGWALSSSAGYSVKFAGVLTLPPLMAKNMAIEPTFDGIHKYIGWFIGIVVLGHILMALKHHFIDRDFTLRGMLPRAR